MPRTILVGVDESHNDSKDAIFSAMSFVDKGNADTLQLVSVFGKEIANEDLKRRLLRAYEDDIRGAPVQVGIRPVINNSSNVAEAFLADCNKASANLIAIGAGAVKSTGSLGSVAQRIVEGSHSNVLVAKRHAAAFVPGAKREFLAAVDGSAASGKGLKQLISLCNQGDTINLVVISDSAADAQILEDAVKEDATEIAERGLKVVKSRVPLKNRTAGEVLCDMVHADLHALVVCSANSSAKALGSTTKYCLGHCPISILVLKVFFAA